MENKPNKQNNMLLGDLKSIHSALDQDKDVPLLDDVVQHKPDPEEPPPTQNDPPEDAPVGLEDATIWALLGDDWKETSDEAFVQVQKAVDENEGLWRGKDTDALNKALKVRIDQTLHAWLQETVTNNIESLRKTLLNALTDEIEKRIAEIDVSKNEG